ncbi:MAG: tetratricopeptide repeat protein [Candidatus Promineifilaceae bacterium]
MGRIELHDYLNKIEALLAENRLAETSAHCRHILSRFPRHLATYRLYARALLEEGDHPAAIDLLQRVLSADPDDLMAHAGLAQAWMESGDLVAATWHLERASELEPYNRVVQQELRAIYERQGSAAPQRFQLNGAALAHLCLRAGRYPEALAEAQKVLERDPGRSDMSLVLAEALYFGEQRADASRLCSQVLEQFPSALKAHAILAAIWLDSGQVDLAEEHIQHLWELTLLDSSQGEEESVARLAFRPGDGFALPTRVALEYFDGPTLNRGLPPEPVDWLAELGLRQPAPDKDAFEPADDRWPSLEALEQAGAAAADEVTLESAETQTLFVSEVAGDVATVPDAPADVAAEVPEDAAVPDAAPPETGMVQTADALSAESATDFLAALTESAEVKNAQPSAGKALPDAGLSGSHEDFLGWLQEGGALGKEAQPEAEASGEVDWLADLTLEEPFGRATPELEGGFDLPEEFEMPDWLASLGGGRGEEAQPAAVLPEWLAIEPESPAEEPEPREPQPEEAADVAEETFEGGAVGEMERPPPDPYFEADAEEDDAELPAVGNGPLAWLEEMALGKLEDAELHVAAEAPVPAALEEQVAPTAPTAAEPELDAADDVEPNDLEAGAELESEPAAPEAEPDVWEQPDMEEELPSWLRELAKGSRSQDDADKR